MKLRDTIPVLKETYNAWNEHHAPRFGASVAFYSLLSFAPLLVVIAGVLALVLDAKQAQGALVQQASEMIGARGADTVKSLLQSAQKPATGIFASTVAFITLLFGASGVFTELHDALNSMWDLNPDKSGGWLSLVKDRLVSFGMVLAVGFLLLVSLVLSAGLALLGKFFGEVLPVPAFVLESLNFVISFVVVAALFALMFRFVPSARTPWRDVLVGSLGTALLFTIGKFALGLYLGKASVGSAYGAAGSLVAVIVWVYYSAQIFFFGAEFTHVYAQRFGSAAEQSAGKQQAGKAPAVTISRQAPAEAFAFAKQTSPAPLALRAAAGSGAGTTTAAFTPVAPPPGSPSVLPEEPIHVAHLTPVRLVGPVPTRTPKLLVAAGIGFAVARLLGREKLKTASKE